MVLLGLLHTWSELSEFVSCHDHNLAQTTKARLQRKHCVGWTKKSQGRWVTLRLGLEAWAQHLHWLGPAGTRDKKQNIDICLFHAHLSQLNVRHLGNRIASSKGKHRFFSSAVYGQAESQLQSGGNVRHWHSYASCEMDSFILLEKKKKKKKSRRMFIVGSADRAGDIKYLLLPPSNTVVQQGIISKLLSLQEKCSMHLSA